MSKRRKNKNKKKKKQHEGAPAPAQTASAAAPDPVREEEALDTEVERLSARGKKTIGGGIAVLALGFYVLTLTDPSGRNWASTLSPLLILGAYAIIAFGIFLPDPAEAEEGESPSEKTESSAPAAASESH
jgi:hypothetical protein